MRKRIAFIGASNRALNFYGKVLLKNHTDEVEFVGVHDINAERMRMMGEELEIDLPAFADAGEMLDRARPDFTIVTTRDSTHHEFVVEILSRDLDAICEKPMTIDADKVKTILDAERTSQGRLLVTMNYRYVPVVQRLHELVAEGVIGTPVLVDMHWLLDTVHGASYFRRWNRTKASSGGLLVHKASHHFDMVNWILGQEPERISASGDLWVYGSNRAERGERCLTCDHKKSCEFFWDITADAFSDRFYRGAEGADGYIRDACVFDPEIDIEDTLTLMADYSGGARLSYSLYAYAPWEGFTLTISGTKGRLETRVLHRHPTEPVHEVEEIRLLTTDDRETVYRLPAKDHGHAGADRQMLRDILSGAVGGDPATPLANGWGGAMAVMVGIAGNESIRTGEPTSVKDLLL